MRGIPGAAIFLVAIQFCGLIFTPGARGVTYNVDLAPNGILLSGESIQLATGLGVSGVQGGYLSPFFSFSRGDVVNFGSVVLDASLGGDQYGDVYVAPGSMQVFFSPSLAA